MSKDISPPPPKKTKTLPNNQGEAALKDLWISLKLTKLHEKYKQITDKYL